MHDNLLLPAFDRPRTFGQARGERVDHAVLVLLAPSLEELERRLRGRGTEDEETLQRRLASAASEIEAVQETGLFDQAIVNDDIDDCYNQVEGMMRKVIESIVLPTEISS